jgi:putative ABC transport system permease protein
MTSLWGDVLGTWRSLRRAPAFVISVTTLLALGIGGNAAVLGVVDAAFLRPLPVPNPDQIVAVFSTPHGLARTTQLQGNSIPDYESMRDRIAGISGLAAYEMETVSLGDSLSSIPAWSALVSGNYFKILNVVAQRGRMLSEDDARTQLSEGAAVISDAMWRDRFAGSSTVVGSRITLGKGHFVIVGVAPRGFTGIHPEGRTDVWITYSAARDGVGITTIDSRSTRRTAIVGRLLPGATLGEVQASVNRAALDLARSFPAADAGLTLVVAHHSHLISTDESPGVLTTFVLVWVMILLIHLVACSNVATLVLARVSARRRDLGIRMCLGASRGRIIRYSLVESSVLAILGSIGGIVVAYCLIRLMTQLEFLSAFRVGIDPRVLAIVAAITIVSALQFGLWPAREAAREDPVILLGGASTGRVIGRRGDVTRFILAGQVAISLLFATDAVVVFRSFQKQTNASPGFDAEHIVVASVSLPGSQRGKADWRAAYDVALARAAAIHGAIRVAAADGAPLYHASSMKVVNVPTHVYTPGEPNEISTQRIGPGYFAALGASMAHGREFTEIDRGSDTVDQFDVAIINHAMAVRYWQTTDPVGRSIQIGRGAPATIVGVVSDIRDVSATAAIPRVYVPLLEGLYSPFEVLVQTRDSASSVVQPLRSAIAAAVGARDPPKVVTMREIRDQSSLLARSAAFGLMACAAAALLLTSIGLYGMVAGYASARENEIGIRLALGASSVHIYAALLGPVFRLVVLGCIIGTAAAALVVRLEAAWWGPTVALEPLGVGVAVSVFLLSAGLAAFLPAHRAASVSPAVVLSAIQ